MLRLMRTKKSAFFERVRKTRALALFHEVARRVPAYKDFLKKNHVNPTKVKTFKDFELVPPVSKKNYLKEYPLQKLSWDGTLETPLVWTSTSGSTGTPFYFSRNHLLDDQYSSIVEYFLNNGLRGASGPTLVIIGFGMGVWIGGLITYQAYELAARRGNYPVSILTTGINKKEIFNALRQLAPNFSQTILVGYAPFIKDIIDAAPREGVNIRKLNLRLHFAAEAFTDHFRDHLAQKGGLKNIYLDTMNIYGSADIGAMAFETPTSIFVRRHAAMQKSRELFNDVFGDIAKTPTLAQYDPSYITFEAVKGEILLTGTNSIPLVRYAIGDHGGAMSFDEVAEKFKAHGTSLRNAAASHGLQKYVTELPFVFVYERTDFTTTLYGLQVYPEHVREALIEPPARKYLTGKFTMTTKFDKKHKQYLEVNLETLPNAKLNAKAKASTQKTIVGMMEKLNSEFRELHRFLGKRAWPRLIFWPAEHPKYFRPGVKQKWVQRL